MTARYPRVYAALKRAGFSPTIALEIIIDAKRGSKYALAFIHIVRRSHA